MSEEHPAEIFHPSIYIRDEVGHRKWTVADFAKKAGFSLALAGSILSGCFAVSPEIARGLHRAFGTSTTLWLNLQAAWERNLSSALYEEWERQNPGCLKRG
jgi:plasmid maintenance system antidote protein VapI